MVSKLRKIIDSKKSAEGLDLGDFRMTRQRKVVYDVLQDTFDHPTASEVYIRAKEKMDGISLATVYNCLETLAQVGLVKQVNVDREATRFCPNLEPHAHFYCPDCQQVFDVGLRPDCDPSSVWDLPAGSSIELVDVAMKGKCAECSGKDNKS